MLKIKVVHIITRLDKGGSAENTLLTVMGLDKKRYDVLLVKGLSVESNMTKDEVRAVEKDLAEAERKGVRIITSLDLLRRIHPFYDLKAFFALIKILRDERPHIVHAHTSKAGFLGRWAAFFTGVPLIVHTPHGHVFWGYSGRFKTSLYIVLEKITALITDKIIALTKQEKNEHLYFCIASEDKFSVVHSGIDLGKFQSQSVDSSAVKTDLGIPEGNLVVGTVGRLTSIKGQRYLIEAAGRIVKTRPDTTFVFVGDGELLDELRKMGSRLGIEKNIKFSGWRSDVAEVMSIFDIFVLPSLNEGMGRVLAEAMALGKPIVASNVGGISDLIADGENGFLVPPKDAEAMSAKINDLLKNAKKRRNMGENGKSRAVNYGSGLMVEKIDQLYRKGLQQKQIS